MNPVTPTTGANEDFIEHINQVWDSEVDPEFLLHDARDLGQIPIETIRRAMNLITECGVLDMVKRWRAADSTYRGGRPRSISDLAILTLWLVAAMEGHPMQLKVLAHMVDSRLSAEGAALLGIKHRVNASGTYTYHQIDRATDAVVDLFDAFPLFNRSRRLTVAELNAELAAREADPEREEEMRLRARQFRSAMLWATYLLLPQQYRTEKVSLAIDATATKAWARGIGRKRLAQLEADAKVSIEPDHGFYLRHTEDHGEGPKGKIKNAKYALEIEFAVLLSNDPDQPNVVPHIALGIASHRPSSETALQALNMIDDVLAKGVGIDHVVTDRQYLPGSAAKDLQNPLRDRGIKMVFDFKKDQLGNQGEHHGALLIDGTFYCPAMPVAFQRYFADTHPERDAEKMDKNLSKREKAERLALRQAADEEQVAQRTMFQLRPKERPDERGNQPMMCPAAGQNPTVRCPLKPRADLPATIGLRPITNPPKYPGKICTNKSSTTFHINTGGKTRQEYPFRSSDWTKWYGQRNVVEGFNAYMKSSSGGEIGSADRRRMRGRTLQEFLITMVTSAANIQKVQEFLQDETARIIETGDRRAPEAAVRSSRHARKTLVFKGRIAKHSKIGQAQ